MTERRANVIARRNRILDEIAMEREDQDRQHGAQVDLPVVRDGMYYGENEQLCRSRYERRKSDGTLSHADIITEEIAEAFYAHTTEQMREELVQAAACCVKALEALDYQAAQKRGG